MPKMIRAVVDDASSDTRLTCAMSNYLLLRPTMPLSASQRFR
jgi:hypothetical protein